MLTPPADAVIEHGDWQPYPVTRGAGPSKFYDVEDFVRQQRIYLGHYLTEMPEDP